MRLLCTGLLCLLLCGCFAAPPPQEPVILPVVEQPPVQTIVDLTDKEPRYRLGWPLTIGLAACMFLMPIILTKARRL